MITKICTKCGFEKDINLFVTRSKSSDGHGTQCKKCHNQYGKKRYYDNIEESRAKGRARTKQYNDKNKERHNQRFKKYRLTHKEQRLATERKYRVKNPDKVKEWKKRDAEKHKEKRKEHNKEYSIRNRNKLNEKSRIYRNSNPQNKIKHNLRNRIRIVLKGLRKGGHLPELIGCSVDFLKRYIESQFTIGMTWDNYGRNGWEVDHKIPCNAFDFNILSHQLACFNWRNLQPMFKIPNIQKGTKYNKEEFNNYMNWFIENVINK